MGTTRIKVIDLSSDEKEIKTSRKHAEKLTGAAKLKEEKKPKKVATTETTEEKPVTVETTKEEHKTTEKKSVGSAKPSVSTVVAKPQSLHHKGHKYLAAKAKIEKGKQYKAKEALTLLAETSIVKFDPTVELHLSVVDKNVKGSVNLPHPISAKVKEKRYLVFADKKQEVGGAKIIWGDDKTIDEIEGGQLKPGKDFEAVVSTPQLMPKIAKIAKILGPLGLMPNPKNKTVTDDIEKALKTKDEGFTYKTEQQAPVIHTKLGKLSNKSEDLEENLKALILAIGPQKIRKATLSSTMGPGIKLDISSVSAK